MAGAAVGSWPALAAINQLKYGPLKIQLNGTYTRRYNTSSLPTRREWGRAKLGKREHVGITEYTYKFKDCSVHCTELLLRDEKPFHVSDVYFQRRRRAKRSACS